jgi:purine-binding chemotaxis protein CheW
MTNQIVVFQLNGQSYGVDITEVNEIIRMQEITQIPNSAHHVEGITNLRGAICSVVNGRILLGLPTVENTSETKIIILDGAKVGVLVDQVSEILTVEEEDKKGFSGMESLEGLGFIDYLVESRKEIITVLRLKEMIVPANSEEELVAVEA